MARLQLALNVSDLAISIDFYTKLFNTAPTKTAKGYANFAIAHPPLKLILFESNEESGTINHLGVEVTGPDAVTEQTRRLESLGLDIRVESQTRCCYALQDKVWVDDPDGLAWETYTVIQDLIRDEESTLCCTP